MALIFLGVLIVFIGFKFRVSTNQIALPLMGLVFNEKFMNFVMN